jgi:hypothetical protein
MKPLSRRTLLQSTAAALPLPFLDAMMPSIASAASKDAEPKRFIIIHSFLGFHAPEFIPKKSGQFTQLGRILEPWDSLKSKFSILSGLEHQEAGHGHAGVIAFTTGRHPARHGGRRSISADQRIAEIIGGDTRFDSLTLQAGGGVAQGLSWSRSGARRAPLNNPEKAFDHLFTPKSAEAQKRYLSLQTSVLDSVLDEAKSLNSKLGPADRAKFDEYQTSLRDLELRAKKQKQWTDRPFPVPKGKRPSDMGTGIIPLMPHFVDLIALAFQTDSTRVVTLDLPGSNHVFSSLKGVTGGHHGLSHHGQRPDKIEQLVIVEREIASQVKRLLNRLEATPCKDGSSMLDNTVVLFGSGLGNGSSHSTKDLPVLVAGGGFKHGKHHAYNREKNDVPFCNLYMSIFKQLGIKDKQFGDSDGVLEGLV